MHDPEGLDLSPARDPYDEDAGPDESGAAAAAATAGE